MSDSRIPASERTASTDMASPAQRRRGLPRLSDIGIGRRLALAFSVLIGLVIVVGIVAIVNNNNLSQTREFGLLVEEEKTVIFEMRLALGRARDSVLNLLHTSPVDGFEIALSLYGAKFNEHTQTIRDLIAQEEALSQQRSEEVEADRFVAVKEQLQSYETLFDDLVGLLEQRGSFAEERGLLNDVLGNFETVGELANELGARDVEAEARHTVEEFLEYVVTSGDHFIETTLEHAQNTQVVIGGSALSVSEKNRLLSMEESARGVFNELISLDAVVESKSAALQEIEVNLIAELDSVFEQEVLESEESQAAQRVAETQTQTLYIVSLIPIILVGAGAAYLVGRSITSPIGKLTAAAERIAHGNLTAQADVQSDDEIGLLAQTFNSMATQIQTLVGSLETQVANRTSQLEASAEVGRAATSILSADQLLREVVYLITERFGFFHAAAFTLDRTGKYAVLRAATGAVGEAQLEQGLSLRVDGKSMVGFAVTHRRPRFSFDVSQEEVYAEPRLPETQSEIALPLIVSERVVGVLDVQSVDKNTFDATTISILQSTADQIAIALDNANSYAAAQEAIQQSRALYSAAEEVGRLETDLYTKIDAMMHAVGETIVVDQWWVVLLDERRERLIPASTMPESTNPDSSINVAEQPNSPAVRSALYGETFVVNDPEHDMRLSEIPFDRRAKIGKFISVPILTPRQPIGAVNFGRTIEGRDMSESELRIGQSLASLAAIAIENQRLFDEMQRVLKEVDTINRHLTGEAWSMALRRAQRSGVLHIGPGGKLLDDTPSPESQEAMASRSVVLREHGAAEMTVAVPLMLRGIPIGVMHLRAPARAWDDDMAATVTRIADHVAQSVENARLLEETEVRFARERALHESTDKVRRGTDVERIVQTAAEELARHLNASRVSVHVGLDQLESDGHSQNGETPSA